jgi:PadR family transcriptional regulator AphA
MALRFAILGALSQAPASGYDLVRQFDKKLNFVWWASQGAIYGELPRMQAEGLIAPYSSGPRGRQSYEITTAGRTALQDWLRATPERRPRDDLVLRIFSLWLLPPDDAADYLDGLADQYREQLSEYRRRQGDRPASVDAEDRARLFDDIALAAGVAHESAMLQWAEESAERLRQAAPQGPPR